MWLINTKTLRLEEFQDYSTVEYAILSHTWGDDEVSFKDMQDFARAKRQAGFVKIATTCELALKEGLEYAWVDTCCIDKTSSAELSEAINAMFVWYQASAACFVWLEDLAPLSSTSSATSQGRKLCDMSKLASCKWFSRGWTLQELLAPANVRFYDANWNFRFTKENYVSTLSTITKIEVEVLKMAKRLKDVLVAVKMSWAANRETTRPEDEAYCLLGIFDINMPMLYGEGNKSFQRLQEQITSQHEDASIFAWMAPFKPPMPAQSFRGVFATSPQQFASSGQISRPVIAPRRPSIRLGSQRVMLDVPIHIIPQSNYVQAPLYLECLTCDIPHEIFISLLYTKEGFVRVSSESCSRLQDQEGYRQIAAGVYCCKVVDPEDSEALESFASKPIEIRSEVEISLRDALPFPVWDPHSLKFCGDALSDDFCGLVYIQPAALRPLRLALVINKLVNEEIDLRFFYGDSADGQWKIVGGSRKEDMTTYTRMDINDLSKEYKATTSSHLYGRKASASFERAWISQEGYDGAKVEAVANGLVITISLSRWSSHVEEVEEASDNESNEATASRSYDSSSRKRRAALPEPVDGRKPRRSKRLKMKKSHNGVS